MNARSPDNRTLDIFWEPPLGTDEVFDYSVQLVNLGSNMTMTNTLVRNRTDLTVTGLGKY